MIVNDLICDDLLMFYYYLIMIVNDIFVFIVFVFVDSGAAEGRPLAGFRRLWRQTGLRTGRDDED